MDCDHAIGAQHLELEVCVGGWCHGLDVGRPGEDRVVAGSARGDLKLDRFGSEIFLVPKNDL